MPTLTSITIPDVDPELLDRQRKLVADLSFRATRAISYSGRRQKNPVLITKEEAEALSGIINMLDSWSDDAALVAGV